MYTFNFYLGYTDVNFAGTHKKEKTGAIARWSERLLRSRSGVHYPSQVIPKDFKKIVGYSQLPYSAFSTKEIVEKNKPPSLFVVSLGKTLCGMPPSLCGRQVAGPRSLSVVVAQSN